ncbi:MAG: nuclear transport factor 2 family protein [Actinobacteria bacterium]|nr:nuclear transport factor 2 family protein [Actinomycetota bacterium]
MDPVTEDEKAVAEANQAFYEAFEARDLAALAGVWEQSERATCTHPGWPTLRGWSQIVASFESIFAKTPFIQFFLTEERVNVQGEVAWVVVEENVLQAHQTHGGSVAESLLGDATAEAVNVFVRQGREWKMVLHHAAAVTGIEEEVPPPSEPGFNN